MPQAVVFLKHVPVQGAHLRIEDGAMTRANVPHGLDAINEIGLEWAISLRETGELDAVHAVVMGPQDAVESLRRALAMGVDTARLVTDPALAGADVRLTARTLAAVVRTLNPEIVLFGYESQDGSSGAVPAAVAGLLDLPLISRARIASLDGDIVRAERDIGSGAETVEAPLPTVLSFVEGGVEPRYPKLKDVLRAKRAPIEQLSATDLGLDTAVGRAVTDGALVEAPYASKDPVVVEMDGAAAAILQLLEREGVHA